MVSVDATSITSLLSLSTVFSPYEFTYRIMGWNSSSTCTLNCSGHGECNNGTCHCEIQYEGLGCHDPNVSYFVGFATIFFVLAAVSLTQLVMCVMAEFRRMKAPSLLRACRITTQKFLYFLVFLVAIIRGIYFSSPDHASAEWSSSLLSAYYPITLTGASLLVCFWAEVFHLRDIRWERSQFLSKSFLGFFTFNLITYSLLLAECILNKFGDASIEDKSFYSHVFNGCYAALMFIVVVFFLVYGVEVYFKVRGGFLPEPAESAGEDPVTERLVEPIPKVQGAFLPDTSQSTDRSQLHQSRLGLISQAFMLIAVIGFLLSEILGEFWKNKVPMVSRNCYNVIYRVVEIGVVLWFPCVLWNCMRPDQLWILNPKRILRRLELEVGPSHAEAPPKKGEERKDSSGEKQAEDEGEKTSLESSSTAECWICYDSERSDAGPLIQPCLCRGDTSTVHHDCLRRWLTECSGNPDSLKCGVCKAAYDVEKSQRPWWVGGLNAQQGLQLGVIVTSMCLAVAGAWATIQLFASAGIRILAVGLAAIVLYICMRFLGLNTLLAYQRGKVSSVKILGHEVSTVSAAVEVDPGAVGVPDCPQTQI